MPQLNTEVSMTSHRTLFGSFSHMCQLGTRMMGGTCAPSPSYRTAARR
jgi:hypothetical protein